jgi:hypothetical protein
MFEGFSKSVCAKVADREELTNFQVSRALTQSTINRLPSPAIEKAAVHMSTTSEAKEEGVEPDHANGNDTSKPSGPVGFFHPELREVRSRVFRGWAWTGEFTEFSF